MYGGESMKVEYLTPSDITIRGNYFFKPLAWETVTGINAKNLLELKHVRNIVIDGNVFRNSFRSGGQNAIALTLTVRNQNGDNPWSTVQNVQITNNKIDNVGVGFGILGLDDFPGHASIAARNFIIRNNLWERVGAIANSYGWFGSLNRPPFKVWINHNTVFHTGNMMRGDGVSVLTNDSDFHFDNNILKHNSSGFKGEGVAPANGFDYLNTFVPGWWMRRNVIAFGPDEWQYSGTYPNDLRNENRYIQDSGSYATFYSQFVNFAQGDFHLTTQSLGHQWATDFTGAVRNDVGCNIDQLGSATAGSEAGNWPLP
jgi:hypothetical protein